MTDIFISDDLSRPENRINAALFGILVCLSAVPAAACGGLACDPRPAIRPPGMALPVAQSSERILFVLGQDEVSAHIQVSYAGSARDFAWILPLPAVPEIGLGSERVFDALDATYAPQATIRWLTGSACLSDPCGGAQPDSPDGRGSDPAASDSVPDSVPMSVKVLRSGTVGPYAFHVVASPDDAAIIGWLVDNGYVVTEQTGYLIEYYANIGFVFLAVRLQNDADAGDIRPLVLRYASGTLGPGAGEAAAPGPTLACVPLMLTAIAAVEDMAITVYVHGSGRAVALNFFHVELNDHAIPWLQCLGGGGFVAGWDAARCANAYGDLARDAIDLAGGHAFITDFAGKPTRMRGQLLSPADYSPETFAKMTDAADFVEEVTNLGQRLGAPESDVISTLADVIPYPGSTHPRCNTETKYFRDFGFCRTLLPAGFRVDPTVGTAAIEARLVAALREAQALFDGPGILTRLTTIISPDEMNKDPIFAVNPDLPDVSNVLSVDGAAYCAPESQRIELRYADGAVVRSNATYGCGLASVEAVDPSGPAASSIEIMSASGPPEVIAADDVPLREPEIEARGLFPAVVQAPSADVAPVAAGTASCSSGGRSTRSAPLLWLLALAGVAGRLAKTRVRRR